MVIYFIGYLGRDNTTGNINTKMIKMIFIIMKPLIFFMQYIFFSLEIVGIKVEFTKIKYQKGKTENGFNFFL